MRSKRDFIKDGLVLTATMLLLRTFGVFFSAKLSMLAGAAVMGMYTQIMTVYSFAVTAAAAGVNLGAMRITSESIGSENYNDVRAGVRESLIYCLKAGMTVSLFFFISASFLGSYLLCDKRTVSSLRALSFALPFISLSNAFHGYFTGVKRISRSAVVNILEQFFRISSTLYVLGNADVSDPESICLLLVVCNASSEALSFFTLSVFYLIDRGRFPSPKKRNDSLSRRFTSITLPVAGSSLIRSGLTTAEHIIIPIGLRASGADAAEAMAKYGTVSGMVLPILLYPMALLSAFASITISELSARVSSGERREKIADTVEKGLKYTLIYAVGCASVTAYFSDALGKTIYQSAEAGEFLRLCAPLILFMYLDHVSDGMLKGLDKQNYVMKVNIIDAALSVLFAVILIPSFGVYGFIASMYICEILNCSASFGMLMKLTCRPPKVASSVIFPAFCAFLSVILTETVLNRLPLPFGQKENLIIGIIFTVSVYILLVFVSGEEKKENHRTDSQKAKAESASE